MSRIADQCDPRIGPARRQTSIEERPAAPVARRLEKLTGVRMPLREKSPDGGGIARRGPKVRVLRAASPTILDDGHDIDEFAVPKGIMNEVRATAEPYAGFQPPSVARRLSAVDQGAPGGLAGPDGVVVDAEAEALAYG